MGNPNVVEELIEQYIHEEYGVEIEVEYGRRHAEPIGGSIFATPKNANWFYEQFNQSEAVRDNLQRGALNAATVAQFLLPIPRGPFEDADTEE